MASLQKPTKKWDEADIFENMGLKPCTALQKSEGGAEKAPRTLNVLGLKIIKLYQKAHARKKWHGTERTH